MIATWPTTRLAWALLIYGHSSRDTVELVKPRFSDTSRQHETKFPTYAAYICQACLLPSIGSEARANEPDCLGKPALLGSVRHPLNCAEQDQGSLQLVDQHPRPRFPQLEQYPGLFL